MDLSEERRFFLWLESTEGNRDYSVAETMDFLLTPALSRINDTEVVKSMQTTNESRAAGHMLLAN